MHLPLSQWKSRGEQVGSTGFERTRAWVRGAGRARLHCRTPALPQETAASTLRQRRGREEKQGCGSNLVGGVWPNTPEALGLITSTS